MTAKKIIKKKTVRKKKSTLLDFKKLSLLELVAAKNLMMEHRELGFGRMTSEGKRLHSLRLAELEKELSIRLYGVIIQQDSRKTIMGVKPENVISAFEDAKKSKRFVVSKNPVKKEKGDE